MQVNCITLVVFTIKFFQVMFRNLLYKIQEEVGNNLQISFLRALIPTHTWFHTVTSLVQDKHDYSVILSCHNSGNLNSQENPFAGWLCRCHLRNSDHSVSFFNQQWPSSSPSSITRIKFLKASGYVNWRIEDLIRNICAGRQKFQKNFKKKKNFPKYFHI